MSLPSVMAAQHNFSQIPEAEIQRSSIDRSHGYKTTFNGGYLVPIFLDEVLPGDTFNLRMTSLIRLQPTVVVPMDNLYATTFFFFVPNRLTWVNWPKFCGEQENPGDSTDFTIPQVEAPSIGGWVPGTLADYFGLPLRINSDSNNALPFRAVNLIWNTHFRDQNMQDSLPVHTDNGPDPATSYKYNGGTENLPRRGKRHDYFTSCLPLPQKGPAVTIPLGGTAPVVFPTPTGAVPGSSGTTLTPDTGENIQATAGAVGYTGVATGAITFNTSSITTWPTDAYTDLATATAATINAIRLGFQLQKLYERDNRGGTRYIEILNAHFKVTSPDARLQRPEYLGGKRTNIRLLPVPQTAPTVLGQTPQGNLSAFAVAQQHGDGFTKSFVEHGFVIGFISVQADLTYQQGKNRMWTRLTRVDHYWPALSHIGEQAVLSKEIFCDGTGGDEDVFGYQERWAEYRYKPSLITGIFRSTEVSTLDVWHLSQEFGARPTLGNDFIVDNPPLQRVLAVTSQPQLKIDAYFDYKCARPMPVYSVPGLIDHF